MLQKIDWFRKGFLNSYTQIFFSDNKLFAALLIPVTFIDFYAGLFGLICVLFTNLIGYLIGLDTYKIQKGYYGFNSLLVGLGLGIYYEPGVILLILVLLAAIFTLFISVTIEGVIGKYYLPHLSLPFVFALWLLMLSSREFYALSLNERWIYTLNDLFIIGGPSLVSMYEWWNQLMIPSPLRSYFLSLGAILFQFSVLSGIIIAIGLLIYSRIAFSLSLLGFFAAWLFYWLIGAEISEVGYSYVGFNYILTAIALGGFFIIPNIQSYFWVILVVPMVAIVTISMDSFLSFFHLPVYALPFNITVLIFLYVLQFRVNDKSRLYTWFIQRNSPERNLYSFLNYHERFAGYSEKPLKLPFFGEWTVTQGHNGEYTHKDDWKHAWDFEMADDDGKTFKNNGDFPDDYYCFDKSVIAAGDGIIEEVIDDIDDNIIGKRNLIQNWGNTVVIKHADSLYSKLSHLKQGSVKVKRGDRVRTGDVVGLCGNSGNSPYPHLHFQIQATPHIGSKTLNYPITNYYQTKNSGKKLVEVGIPKKGDHLSNIQINTALKKAFELVPGRLMEFNIEGLKTPGVKWEVKIDNQLNRYIECLETGSKAYFKHEPAMVHFLYFDGERSSLLYYFYLSAYKISFGFENGLILKDRYPVNMIFKPWEMFFHDFIAPFFRFLEGNYKISYPGKNDLFDTSDIQLTGTITKKVFGRKISEMVFRFRLNKNGLQDFHFSEKNLQIKAICEK